MNCPACGHSLSTKKVGEITVDMCAEGCGGIWFDRFEIQKVDEPAEAAGEELLQDRADSKITVDLKKRRNCPKCVSMVMMQHFWSVKRQVTVDECPKCAGFWLDVGELAMIRQEYSTEKERKGAAAKYFDDLFGNKLAEMRKVDAASAERAKRIAQIFRFICPSYYIPGKQEGGAF